MRPSQFTQGISLMTHHAPKVAACLICAALIGCSQKPAEHAKPGKPATVTSHPDESRLFTIQLTPQAESRLGIQVADIQSKNMPQYRTYSGIAMLPHGQSIVVTAPVTGRISLPEGDKEVHAGQRVSKSQPLLSLIPILTPERSVLTPVEQTSLAESHARLHSEQMNVRSNAAQAAVAFKAADIEYNRTKQLLEGSVGSQRDFQAAEHKRTMAQLQLQNAEAQLALWSKIDLLIKTGSPDAVAIPAPLSGIVMNRQVSAADQQVNAGAAV